MENEYSIIYWKVETKKRIKKSYWKRKTGRSSRNYFCSNNFRNYFCSNNFNYCWNIYFFSSRWRWAVEEARLKAIEDAKEQARLLEEKRRLAEERKRKLYESLKEQNKIKVLSSGGVRVGGVEYVGNAVVTGTGGKTANQIQNEWWKEARKQGITKRGTYSVDLPSDYYVPKKIDKKLDKGLDIIPIGNIQEELKKEKGGKLDLSKGIKSKGFPKDIVFITPEEQKYFTGDRGYTDFDVIDFTKTKEVKEGEEGQQFESLSDFTSSLSEGSYAISLKGDLDKVKEVGVSKKIKKVKTKEGEIYDPITGMFISESPTGLGATDFLRSPTQDEQREIYRASVMGSYAPLPEGIEAKEIGEKIIRGGIDLARTDFKVPVFFGAGGIKASELKDIGEEQLAKEDVTFGEKLLFTPISKMPTTYGELALLGGAGYLAPATAGIATGAMLFEPLIKEGLSKGGKKVEQAGEFLQTIPDTEIGRIRSTDSQVLRNLGLITEIGGKAIRGSSYLVPETSGDVLTFALFEKALASKMVPKIAKSLGLKGLSGYEIYGGLTGVGLTQEERYGKILVGGLAGLGSIPEDITLVRKFKARFFKDFAKTKVGEFGIQETKLDLGKTDIKLKSPGKAQMEMTFDPVTLEFIPTRSEVFTKRIDVLKVLGEKVNLKKSPKIPKTNKIQTEILNVVKERGDIISGSFAQQTLIEGSRKFKDLDILSNNPEALAKAIKLRLGKEVTIKEKLIIDSPLGKFKIYKVYNKQGKHIADLDPIKFGEEGFASLFSPVKVKGYNLLPPEVRLISKALQQARPLQRAKKLKVLKDISQLKGEPSLEVSPSLSRGYGLTKAEQIRLAEGKELFFTHAGLGIKSKKGKIELSKDFWATQSIMKEGILSARKSRMGFKDVKYASWLDLLKPSERKKISFIPKQREIIFGKTGKMKKGKTKKGWEIPKEIKSTEIEIVKRFKEKKPKEFKVIKEMSTILEGEPVRIRYVKEARKTKVQKLLDEKLKIKEIKRKSKTRKDESDLNKFLKEQGKRKGTRERIQQEELILRTPQKPIFRIAPREIPKEIIREIPRDVPREILMGVQRDIPRTKIKELPRTTPRDIPREILRGVPRDIPKEVPREVPRDIPREIIREIPRDIPRDIPRTPPRSPPKKPIIIRFPKKRLIKQPIKKAPSYDVYIKPPKKKAYVKITKKPIGLQEARDTRNYFIDETTSRQGFIKPRQVKPSKLMFDIPRGYAERTVKKFRGFRQKKGVRTKLPKERVIEYSKYALDTKGEKQQLNVFKLLAQRERKKMNKKKPIGLQFA